MEANEQNLKGLAQQFSYTLSGNKEALNTASQQLKEAEVRPGFPVCLLRLLTVDGVSLEIKLAASVYFKNYVMKFWEPDTEKDVVSANDRQLIKQHIVQLMINMPKNIQAQLSQALGIISQLDFPEKWQSLLPELVGKFQSEDFGVLTGVLETANSIFHRYRHEQKSQKLWEEIAYVLKHTQEPLLVLFKRTLAQVQQVQNDATNAPRVFRVLVLLTQIFYALNAQEIPEFFEDHIREWMDPFLTFLNYKNTLLDPRNDEPGLLDVLQTEICEALTLYANKYEEQFNELVPPFVQATWQLLSGLSDSERFDALATTALKFLTSVVKKAWHKKLFESQQTLEVICQRIVMPQLKLRASDVELFESNGLEYIRRDMEGSDVDTRRRTTVDFVRGLCSQFEEQVTTILRSYSDHLLKEYSSDPKGRWMQKDAAMYVILALAAKASNRKEGITAVSPYIDIVSFFANHVLPELQNSQVNEFPILKADCLKFVAAFRNQLPAQAFPALLEVIGRHLDATEFVGHTYAAVALEKLLTAKDNGVSRVSKDTLKPCLQGLFNALFKALEHEESHENDYIMKAIMRVCGVAEEATVPFAPLVIQRVTAILAQVAKNPRNPTFNHFLFETLACLVKVICTVNPGAVGAFEGALFPSFQQMLSMQSCPEFGPYVFQIMAQLLDFRKDVSPAYRGIFPSLLAPVLWDTTGNIPPISRLLTSCLRKDPQLAMDGSRLEGLLGIFQKLCGSKKWDKYGLRLLGTLIEALPMNTMKQYLPMAFALIFKRLQERKTPQFVACLVLLLTQTQRKYGLGLLLEVTNQLQPNLLLMLIEKVWLPGAVAMPSGVERKAALLGLDAMLKDQVTLNEPYFSLWGKVLAAALEIVSQPMVREKTAVQEDDTDVQEKGLGSSFIPLQFAQEPDVDLFPDVAQPVETFSSTVQSLAQQQKTGQVISQLPSDQLQRIRTGFKG